MRNSQLNNEFVGTLPQPDVLPEADSGFSETTDRRSVVLIVNKQQYTFYFKPDQTGADLATAFCTKVGPSLGFTESTNDQCFQQMRTELDAKLLESENSLNNGDADLSSGSAVVDAQGGQVQQEQVPGVRHLRLSIQGVVYVFEYHVDMSPEYAAPRLASEFCFSEKGRQTLAPQSEENQKLSEVERDALIQHELDSRCVKPLTAALLKEIAQ